MRIATKATTIGHEDHEGHEAGNPSCSSCPSWLIVFLALVAAVGAQEPDRSKAPALGPPPKLDLPAIQKKVLTNGLPVWIIERHKVPLV